MRKIVQKAIETQEHMCYNKSNIGKGEKLWHLAKEQNHDADT